ncbi:MAG TPA: DUF6089 family protein [Paludibacteraceae bacterium]|nr:DUF6089 family protein [Paludibacteraceae bacterium]HPQ11994.1 DUF6089 family protein [Paludibacteraceae bacterium]
MKKVLIIILLFGVQISFFVVHAQKNGLIGKSVIPNSKSIFFAAAGPAYCFGDVGGSHYEQFLNGINDWDVLNTRYLFSVGYGQSFKHNLGYKLIFNYGNFIGNDKNSRNEARQYSFNSEVSSLSLQAEYTFLGGIHSNYYDYYSLYLFGGIGVMNSNAEVKKNGVAISQPPPDRIYDKIKLNETAAFIPFGIGYKYAITPKFSIGAELCWNYTFTDFIDGISTVTSKENDLLANLSITFSYKFFDSLTPACRCLPYNQ